MLAMWPGPIKQIFVPPTQEGSTLSLVTDSPVATEEMRVRGQKSKNDLDLLYSYNLIYS